MCFVPRAVLPTMENQPGFVENRNRSLLCDFIMKYGNLHYILQELLELTEEIDPGYSTYDVMVQLYRYIDDVYQIYHYTVENCERYEYDVLPSIEEGFNIIDANFITRMKDDIMIVENFIRIHINSIVLVNQRQNNGNDGNISDLMDQIDHCKRIIDQF